MRWMSTWLVLVLITVACGGSGSATDNDSCGRVVQDGVDLAVELFDAIVRGESQGQFAEEPALLRDLPDRIEQLGCDLQAVQEAALGRFEGVRGDEMTTPERRQLVEFMVPPLFDGSLASQS